MVVVERTLVLIKPDAVQRGLIGDIVSRFEKRGLKFIAMKMILVSKEHAERHYSMHVGKPFYAGLINYITSAPLVAAVLEGPKAIQAVRQAAGATNPLEAAPGTIRQELALTTGRNLVHASDSPESAEQEIALWFSPEEINSWERDSDPWVFHTN